MLMELKQGVQTIAAGGYSVGRGARSGALVTCDAHGRFAEAVRTGNVYIGANPLGTPVTTQAGLSATTPALTVYNPSTSLVNLEILTITIGITTAPAANTQLCLAYNLATAVAPASTTAATLVNAKVGTTAIGTGAAYRIATLATAPVACRILGGIEAASSTAFDSIIDHVDGEIIVTPGVAVSIQATTAVAIVATISWEEVPV